MRHLLLLSLTLIFAGQALGQTLQLSGEPERLTGDENRPFMRPVWAPTGDRVLVSGPGYDGLFVIDVGDNQVSQLTDEASAGYGSEWSRDGSAVLARVARLEDGRRDDAVKVFDVETRSSHQLTEYRPSMHSLPRWTPDGSRVFVYAGDEARVVQPGADVSASPAVEDSRVVFVRDGVLSEASIDDPSPRALEVAAEGKVLRMSASVDGSMVAYEVLGGSLVVSRASDGTRLLEVDGGEAPRFSPDGQWVVFMRTEDDGHTITGSDLWAARTDGSAVVRLTQTPDRLEMNPDWSPDGRSIVYDDRGSIFRVAVTQ